MSHDGQPPPLPDDFVARLLAPTRRRTLRLGCYFRTPKTTEYFFRPYASERTVIAAAVMPTAWRKVVAEAFDRVAPGAVR